MPTPTSDRQRQFFVLFLLAMLPAGNALNPCLDVDTWWHLRVGQTIVEQQKLPDHDWLSQLGQQEHVPWIAYSWLYELLLDGAFQLSGFGGILVVRHLLDLLTFGTVAWFLLRHAANAWLGLAVLALVTVSLLPFMSERPWHFTIVFTTLTLHAVQRIRDGATARRFTWLPITYVLWANIHIQFVMGFAVLGLGWLVTLIESRRLQGQERAVQAKKAATLFLLGVGCTLATLITPYYWRLYIVIWEYATQTIALQLVQELQPPVLWKWWNLPLCVLLVAAAACVARGGYRLWDVVLLASALFFSLRMQRDLWYGVLVAGTIIVRGAANKRADDTRPFSAWQIGLVSIVAMLLMRGAWEIGLSQGKTIARCHEESYPVKAVEFIREHDLRGPLYNNFDWGGFLIWSLRELPVSIDGRTNFYGEARLLRSMRTWSGRDRADKVVEDWENDPDLERANVIIAPSNQKEIEEQNKAPAEIDIFSLKSPLTERLRHSEHWKIAYEDRTAVVFVRVQ